MSGGHKGPICSFKGLVFFSIANLNGEFSRSIFSCRSGRVSAILFVQVSAAVVGWAHALESESKGVAQ